MICLLLNGWACRRVEHDAETSAWLQLWLGFDSFPSAPSVLRCSLERPLVGVCIHVARWPYDGVSVCVGRTCRPGGIWRFSQWVSDDMTQFLSLGAEKEAAVDTLIISRWMITKVCLHALKLDVNFAWNKQKPDYLYRYKNMTFYSKTPKGAIFSVGRVFLPLILHIDWLIILTLLNMSM